MCNSSSLVSLFSAKIIALINVLTLETLRMPQGALCRLGNTLSEGAVLVITGDHHENGPPGGMKRMKGEHGGRLAHAP